MSQNQATRTEKDTMGNVEVPADAYWGAQTQRSRENFKIGGETLPRPMIEAMALVKKAAAITNASLERIEGDKRCLLYTSPSPRDRTRSRMPSSA